MRKGWGNGVCPLTAVRSHHFTHPTGTNRGGSGRNTPGPLRESSVPGRDIRFWRVPESLTDFLPDKIRAAGDHGTLVLYPHGQPVDMPGGTNHRPRGYVPRDHAPSPGTGAGDPVDFKQREGEVPEQSSQVPSTAILIFLSCTRVSPGHSDTRIQPHSSHKIY